MIFAVLIRCYYNQGFGASITSLISRHVIECIGTQFVDDTDLLRLPSLIVVLTRSLPRNAKLSDSVRKFTLFNLWSAEDGEKLLVQRRLQVQRIRHLGLCGDGE